MRTFDHLLRAWAAASVLYAAIGGRYPDCDNGPLRTNDVCNTELDPSKRAAGLVEAMNMTEKLLNLVE